MRGFTVGCMISLLTASLEVTAGLDDGLNSTDSWLTIDEVLAFDCRVVDDIDEVLDEVDDEGLGFG